jgi:two-component system response regulator AtoC
METVLVVDDDRSLRIALKKALRRKGCRVAEAVDGESALQPLRSGISSEGPVDVCVLDLRMPRLDGLGVLRKTVGRKVPVVVLTGHGSIGDAVEAMRLGAANFVQKPVDADELWPVLKQAAGEGKAGVDHEVVGESEAMKHFLGQLDRVSATEEPVLVLGETGTGKELAARRLHDKSKNAEGPFVAFNAACVPRELFESELFGHKKGAFTGASEPRDGLLAEASGGTLFIDEVGDLPLDAQAKLLRAIEERSFRPVGSDTERPFRARLCAATHQDLAQMVEAGQFRADLYYRLGVVPLRLPPLRDRGDDLELLAARWLEKLSDDERQYSLTDGARARLKAHAFPGNVRELINLIKRAVILSPSPEISEDQVDELLAHSPFTQWAETRPVAVTPPLAGAPVLGEVDGGPRAGERVTLEELEKEHIKRLLDEVKNVSEVARIVGIDRRTLQRKMVAWGLRDA